MAACGSTGARALEGWKSGLRALATAAAGARSALVPTPTDGPGSGAAYHDEASWAMTRARALRLFRATATAPAATTMPQRDAAAATPGIQSRLLWDPGCPPGSATAAG